MDTTNQISQNRSITKTILIPSPIGGINTFFGQENRIPDISSPDCMNVKFDHGRITRRLGLSSMFSALATQHPNWFGGFLSNAGIRYIMCSSPLRLYRWNAKTVLWTDMTPGAVDFVGVGSPNKPVSTATLFGKWYYSNGIAPVCYWDGATGSSAINLTNADPLLIPPTRADFICAFGDRLFMIGTTEGGVRYPYRVRWSDFIDTTAWAGGSSGYKDMGEDPYWGMGAVVLKDRMLIFKKSRIYTVTRVGYPYWFSFQSLFVGNGCVAPRTIQSIDGNMCVYMGEGGVYVTDGVTSQCLSDNFAWSDLLDEVNPARVYMAFSHYDNRNSRYFLIFESTPTVAGIVLCYDFKLKAWTKQQFDLSFFMTSAGTYDNVSISMSWSEAAFTWTSADFPWMDTKDELENTILIFAGNAGNFYKWEGQSYLDVATAFTSYWKSKAFSRPGDPNISENTLQKIRVFGSGTFRVRVGSSDNGISINLGYWSGSIWVSGAYSTYRDTTATNGYVDFDVNLRGRFHQIEISSASSDTTFIVNNIGLLYVERGNR